MFEHTVEIRNTRNAEVKCDLHKIMRKILDHTNMEKYKDLRIKITKRTKKICSLERLRSTNSGIKNARKALERRMT